MRAMESRIVDALPQPVPGTVRYVCACILAASVCFVAAFAWSLVSVAP